VRNLLFEGGYPQLQIHAYFAGTQDRIVLGEYEQLRRAVGKRVFGSAALLACAPGLRVRPQSGDVLENPQSYVRLVHLDVRK
jgi:hypothetical protein